MLSAQQANQVAFPPDRSETQWEATFVRANGQEVTGVVYGTPPPAADATPIVTPPPGPR